MAGSDAGGASIVTNTYDEYGRPGWNGYRFAFTGQPYMIYNLLYLRNRVYDTENGRFLQTDPIGYGDGMNLYGYVGGDPVNRIDPTGTQSDDGGLEPPIVVTGRRLYCDRTANMFSDICNGGGLSFASDVGMTSYGGGGGAGSGPASEPVEQTIVVTAKRKAIPRAQGKPPVLLARDTSRKQGRPGSKPLPCQKAFNQCHTNSETLYDRGREQDSFQLRQQCFVAVRQCNALVNQNKQSPVSSGFITFPGRSGAVIIVPGFGPYYIPDNRGPR